MVGLGIEMDDSHHEVTQTYHCCQGGFVLPSKYEMRSSPAHIELDVGEKHAEYGQYSKDYFSPGNHCGIFSGRKGQE
ncbi:hypothetical protein TNCV_614581 [Trichonephila clavipes]|nr:hypothetical protein TNCV_614581 [Trichonephila clavipes]